MKRQLLGRPFCLVVLIFCVAGLSHKSWSQVKVEDQKKEVPRNTISIRSGIRPAFSVSPSVYKIKAKHGQRIPFTFSVKAKEEPVVTTIKAIALRQAENGSILADMAGNAPKQLTIKGGNNIKIAAGETKLIKGEVVIPTDGSPLYTFGLLIRDEGKKIAGKKKEDAEFGIKFITQYILRCDVDVQNVANTFVHQLEVQKSEITEFDGLPMTRVYVSNPTDKTIKFELKSRVYREGSPVKNSFVDLISPVRGNMKAPERYSARILPNSRIYLYSPWPRPVFQGDYKMENQIALNKRVYKSVQSDIRMSADRFPAQNTFVADIAPGVYASPSQIALGKSKPYKRINTFRITNDSNKPVIVDLKIPRIDDKKPEWLSVQPSQVEIPPGSSRRVLVSVAKVNDIEQHKLGFLQLVTRSEIAENVEIKNIPVAFMGSKKIQPKLAIGQLKYETQKEMGKTFPVVVLPVVNKSTIPIPLTGEVIAKDISNNRAVTKAGYGRWLLPNEVRNLRFKLRDFQKSSLEINGTLKLTDLENNVYFTRQWNLDSKTTNVSFSKE